MRRLRLGAGLAVLSTALALSACMKGESTSTDVTTDKKYWGGFEPGHVYALQQDLIMLSVDGRQAHLFVPGQNPGWELASGEKCMVPSVEEYRAAPHQRSYVAGLLPKGVRIRVVKLVLYSFSEDTQLEIHAQPTEGPFGGRDVEIQSLGAGVGDHLALSPRAECLKAAEGAATLAAPGTARAN